MNKSLTLFLVLAMAGFCTARAQEAQSQDGMGKLSAAAATEATAKKTPDGKPAPAEKRGPTEITATKEASFDGKQRVAVFVGEVRVKDSEFTLNADKLTIYMKKQEQAAAGQPGKPSKPASSPAPGIAGGGGLEKALAEGHVVIEKIQPDSSGQPVHYIGKAARVDYNATTGDAILSGWPQVQQGINMHVATEQSTIMYMNREGRMRTEGGSKTIIVDPGPGNPVESK